MVKYLRSLRLWLMWVAAAGVVAWSYFTDPSGGAETMVRVQWVAWVVVLAGPVYLLRRALMDGARSRRAYERAMESPIGAGLVFLGLCLLAGLLFLSLNARAADGPPAAAKPLLPVLADEVNTYWPCLSMPSVLAAQVEQETCITLTHRSCWSPRAELKTSREYGFGLGQHTRAYRADGSLRFDAHAEARERYPALAAWTWDNRYDARLQLRAVVLGNRDCYQTMVRLGLEDDFNALAMCDAAHNGGLAGVLSERRICAGVDRCDPNRWFGHVENHSLKSRVKAAGYGKSWFDINREHVRNVMTVRRYRYIEAMGA